MPAAAKSLRITDLYRARLQLIVQRVEQQTRRRWPEIETFDQTSESWLAATAAAVAGAQREAVRATSGYLAAFLTSELDRRTQPPPLHSSAYAGISRDGRPLSETLESPLIGVKVDLKGGADPSEALRNGLNRALRMVELDTMQASRKALNEGMEADERIEGWQRAVRGTCGACAGDIAVEVRVQLPSLPLRIHPNCMCVTQPVITGVPNLFPLPTGQQLFERMSKGDQDKQFGPEKAGALRTGKVALGDLVEESPQATDTNFITERPLEALVT